MGYRKLAAFLAATAGNCVLVWYSKIDPAVYSTVQIVLSGGFFAANTLAKKTTPTT